MAGISVERRGVLQVMDALDLYKCPYYSVWQKKDLKFSFGENEGEESEDNGRALLQQSLEALEENGSTLVYTIKFHKKTDDDGYISNKTPVVGSFNFKVCDNQGYAQGLSGGSGREMVPFRPVPNADLIAKLDEMQKQITQLQARPVDEEEPSTMDVWAERIDAVGAIIENNPLINQVLQGLVGKFFGNVFTPPTGGGLAGVDTPPATDQEEKIQAALQVLKKQDPEIGDHLIILANLAIKDPNQFKFLISMLNGYK